MESRAILNGQRVEAFRLADRLSKAFNHYNHFSPSWDIISEHLEFSEDERHFYDALLVPEEEGGWTRTGKNRKAVGADYLFREWSHGKGPGIFTNREVHVNFRTVWDMPPAARQAKVSGTVLTEFTIDTLGRPAAIRVIRGVRDDLDQEATRLIRQMPHWTPASVGKKPLATKHTMPLHFQLTHP